MPAQPFLCLLINLDGSEARLATAQTALDAAHVEFTRLPAFDGRAIDLAAFEHYDPRAAQRYMGRELVGGEIGCYMSHLSAAETFLSSDAQHCLVLEDDSAPPADLCDVVAATLDILNATDPAWRIVNLGNPGLKIATPCQNLTREAGSTTLFAAHYFPMTTGAILWSRKGAQDFLNTQDRIFAPVDNYFRHWITRAGHGYAFAPRVVPTTDAVSDIAHAGKTSRSHTARHLLYGWRKQKRLLVDKWIAYRAKRRAMAT